ncbi:WecB/TagA/CpsF family glycosyltransferase [Oculatella sp. LEGE 06141]|uniref:WecB/TagA/CpsF family glycosyltransferase n=1 Tax=Oculatella sp. LEGE 06141 TaxID=1828648 RepID=UPI00188158FD|nr:WecB/TagA/CpsF family glycosyltransferase [Oculatella sp. LEGE 06141]MBE9181198.1 WecB/TagA/CpsF family glycosyltransferase [Oculatella sp. LEGE 06141]
MSRVQVLHGNFDHVTTAETVDWATDLIESNRRGYLCTVNVAILMMMASDPKLRSFVENAALTVADGQPVVWASHWLSQGLPERVTGIDLIDALASRAAQKQFGVYLLGANQDVIRATAEAMQAKYPSLRICGFDDGYFNEAIAPQRVEAIRRSGANILLVGMGVPRQENFIADHWANLGVNLAIGVGGSFEVISGRKQRAPYWMQEVGFEWLYRLMQEPRRLGKRYLTTNSQFAVQVLIEMLRIAVSKTIRRESVKASS